MDARLFKRYNSNGARTCMENSRINHRSIDFYSSVNAWKILDNLEVCNESMIVYVTNTRVY